MFRHATINRHRIRHECIALTPSNDNMGDVARRSES
jgi:hypothetical protein